MVFIIHPRYNGSVEASKRFQMINRKKTHSEEVMGETNYWQKFTLNFKQPDAALKL